MFATGRSTKPRIAQRPARCGELRWRVERWFQASGDFCDDALTFRNVVGHGGTVGRGGFGLSRTSCRMSVSSSCSQHRGKNYAKSKMHDASEAHSRLTLNTRQVVRTLHNTTGSSGAIRTTRLPSSPKPRSTRPRTRRAGGRRWRTPSRNYMLPSPHTHRDGNLRPRAREKHRRIASASSTRRPVNAQRLRRHDRDAASPASSSGPLKVRVLTRHIASCGKVPCVPCVLSTTVTSTVREQC